MHTGLKPLDACCDWAVRTGFIWKLAGAIVAILSLPLFFASLDFFDDLYEVFELESLAPLREFLIENLGSILGLIGIFGLIDAACSPPSIANIRKNIIATDMLCFGLLGLMISVGPLVDAMGEQIAYLIIPVVVYAVCYIVRSVSLARKFLKSRFSFRK